MKPLRVCVVGGIYDKDEAYRKRHALTPETILAASLRDLGCDVETAGHASYDASREYDVVHVHHLGLGALRTASARRRPVFVFTGHAGPMINGYETSSARLMAYRYVVRSADAVVALFDGERRHIEVIRGDAANTHTIPNAIDATQFSNAGRETSHLYKPGPVVRLLYAGQLIPVKGVDVLIEALSLLSGPRTVTLDIASQLPDRESEYRRLAEQFGVAARVNYLGFLDPPALTNAYCNADLFVLPSRSEALPSTIWESLLCGTPVVASAVGGIPGQLQDGRGICVKPGSARALADGLNAAIASADALRERVAADRGNLVSLLDPARMGRAHLDVYHAAIEARVHHKSSRIADAAVRAFLRLRP
jgi:glycosyltransferase involved in cell wall biosynthesis